MTGVRVRTGVETVVREVGGPLFRAFVVVTVDDAEEHRSHGEWTADKPAADKAAARMSQTIRNSLEGDDGVKGEDYRPAALEPGDIIQLDPAAHQWGALLCIVDEVKPWGVLCYWMHATQRGHPPDQCPYRANTGTFQRVGRSVWLPVTI